MTAAAWARALIARAGHDDLPLYGSAQWDAAPETVKVASCVRAAECWRVESDPHVIAARLEQEFEAARRVAELDYAAWREVAGIVKTIALSPTVAELQARRGEVA